MEDDVTNEDIRETLFPGRYAYASPYTDPDYQYIHEELARKGVTLTLLWEEYCEKVRATGGVPYMYTQFCEKYRRWARVTKATMRISHKPGDAMQVDWAGNPLYITDPTTGETEPAYIFVTVLPCSWYTYAEACSDMKLFEFPQNGKVRKAVTENRHSSRRKARKDGQKRRITLGFVVELSAQTKPY